MTVQELREKIEKAIHCFIENEIDLIRQDAHEEAISTHLFTYIKGEFKDFPWHIDHQYDKRIINNKVVKKRTKFTIDQLPKSKIHKNFTANESTLIKAILPVIIFHDRRSQKHNFLAIEVKKTTNKAPEDRAFDKLKLEVMTAIDLKYAYGLFLDLKTGEEFDPDNPFEMNFISDGNWL